jgi:hypothetical protein
VKVVKAGVNVVVTGSQLDRESIEYFMSRGGETVWENDNNDESAEKRKD